MHMYTDPALQQYWSTAYSQKNRLQLDSVKSPEEYLLDPWEALAVAFNDYERYPYTNWGIGNN